MKTYSVTYIQKRDNKQIQHTSTTFAQNAREAIKNVRAACKKDGFHAFSPKAEVI